MLSAPALLASRSPEDALGPLTQAILRELRDEFPNFCLLYKATSPFQRLLGLLLLVVTLGGQRRYVFSYHTVIGDRLYLAAHWDEMSDLARVILLRHERVHLRQRRRYGTLWMAILYLLVPLPLGLAWYRAQIEWEAYRETLRATYELRGTDALLSPDLRRWLIGRFTGPDYGWMWPFPQTLERWYDAALEELLNPVSDAKPRGNPLRTTEG